MLVVVTLVAAVELLVVVIGVAALVTELVELEDACPGPYTPVPVDDVTGAPAVLVVVVVTLCPPGAGPSGCDAAVTAYQVPPKLAMPCPAALPGA